MISLLAIGDFGASTSIRKAISSTIRRARVDAVLGLGDNFYNYGIETVNSPRWETDFEKAFHPKCPWYMTLGNHDYLGNIHAQIGYARKSPYWKMPSRYYDEKIHFKHEKEYAHLFFLDTFELSLHESMINTVGMGVSWEEWERMKYKLQPQTQLNWLRSKLEESRGRWKIVVGHYPVFSCGGHGDNPELIQSLLPIFNKYGVDFYLSGHDHSLQHTTSLNTQFMVSGAGCGLSHIKYDKRFYPVPHVAGLCYLRLFRDKADVGFLDQDGRDVYHKTVLPNSLTPMVSFVSKKINIE